ncbi:MAG: ferredoxin oxidoreductase [Candidatus Magasanikbacteria bacterium]
MKTNDKKFINGYEVVVQAALDAGAEAMYGYPITPTCEILSGWANSGKICLQTEDEIAAGFAVCGAVLAGQKAFSASAGPGHILLQDSFSMAEAMRLPFVMIIGQRGGPSSGTVIYSQQEVTLACYGGNGEGLRLVYSPSTIEELYILTRRAFNESWKYRFPAVVLTDGFTLKTRGVIDFEKINKIENVPAHALVPEDKIVHWQNIYTFEEDLYQELQNAKTDFDNIAPEIVGAEEVEASDAEILLVAHGIVALSAKEAVVELRSRGIKIGLFRPITLRPFPKQALDKVAGAKNIKKIVVIESSMGQFARIVRDELAPEIDKSFDYLQYPGVGIEMDEIISQIEKLK